MVEVNFFSLNSEIQRLASKVQNFVKIVIFSYFRVGSSAFIFQIIKYLQLSNSFKIQKFRNDRNTKAIP